MTFYVIFKNIYFHFLLQVSLNEKFSAVTLVGDNLFLSRVLFSYDVTGVGEPPCIGLYKVYMFSKAGSFDTGRIHWENQTIQTKVSAHKLLAYGLFVSINNA